MPKDKTHQPQEGPIDDEYSLEEILAEYGADTEHQLLDPVVSEPLPEPVPDPEAPLSPETPADAEDGPSAGAPAASSGSADSADSAGGGRSAPKRAGGKRIQSKRPEEVPPSGEIDPAPSDPAEPPGLPDPPKPISVEEIIGLTVDVAMEEREEELLPQRRRGLFSRRAMETEQLYTPPEPEASSAVPEPEPIPPEPEASRTAAVFRTRHHRRRQLLLPAALIALALAAVTAVSDAGIVIPCWTGAPRIQAAASLLALLAVGLLCGSVFLRGVRALGRKRCTIDLLASLSLLVTAADCGARLLLPQRSPVGGYAAVSCAAMVFALWGGMRDARGYYDTFRTAAMDAEPPYLVTETPRGACKQAGSLPGFYTTAMQDDLPTLWQTLLLPLLFVMSAVFAGLGSLGQGRSQDFLLNWSATLAAGTSFAMPLCWSLPFSRLTRRLQKAGCAVAGCAGAEKISRGRTMIVTDRDLFPPGTVGLNGVKLFGEELEHAASYAASMAHASGCGLERLFTALSASEQGTLETVDSFSFYEEGGFSGTIRGESVLLGTASFMRKMDVRLPDGISLKTGVFLAVDHHLAAVFAVKYNASENVDWALRLLRRSHITPILASRDPNVTPALMKRKFTKGGGRVEYPDLSARVALSEAESGRGLPRALLLREGLLPYAQTVAGSRRLCRAARWGTALALFGSVAGLLLAAYLTASASYDLLTATAMLLFALLWTLPILLRLV